MRVNLFKSGGNAAGTGGFVSNGLALQGPLILSGPHNEPLHAVPKQYVDDSVYNLDATRITSGVLPTGRLPVFTGDVTNVLGSNVFVLANIGITAGSYVKPTVDSKGRITTGGTLTASDIANVGWEKISVGRPTTLSGYGITDAVNADNGIMTGELTLHADPVLDTHAVTKQFVDGIGGTSGGVSVGDIVRKTCLSSPDGFLRCNGALVDKTTYSGLYSIIGDAFNITTTIGSGKPWQQQYEINNIQTTGLIGWTTDTSLPGPLGFSQAIVTKNRVYLLGGHNNTAWVSTVYTAPINSNGTLGTWATGTSLPGVLAQSQAIVTKNRVYLLGGFNGTAYVNTVYTAPINSDGTLGSWSTSTALPVIIGQSQAIVTKNRVYMLGGYNGSVGLSTVYTAPINSDGTLGTWTIDVSLPNIIQGGKSIITKNRVYLLGGSTVYTAPINSDGTLGTWVAGISLPLGIAQSQAIVTKNKVYIFGGFSDSKVYSTTINSDGTLGTWGIDGNFPAIIQWSETIITNSRVYLISGQISSVTVSNIYSTTMFGGLNDYSAYYAEDTTNYLMPGSGKPWQQQFQINNTQTADITGWTTGTSLPSAVYSHTTIVTKNRVYLLGGQDGSNLSTVYTAPINSDGTLGTWAAGTSLPGSLSWTQAIVTKNRVYLLGGWTGAAALSIVYTAAINTDGTLGTWTTSTSLPGILSGSQAIITKNRVYLLGGYTSVAVSTVYTAPINTDGTLGTWTTDTSLPGALAYTQAIVTKNRVYLCGGIGSGGTVSTVYTAPINSDGLLGTWSTGTSLPGVMGATHGIVTKNRVYLIGGINATIALQGVYTAPINTDGTLGTWTNGTSMPGDMSRASAIVTKNRIYMLGGMGALSAIMTTVYTASILEGLNDLSPYYDGTILPAIIPETLTFALPDYTVNDNALSDNICSYIKY